jgi:hypothetical protein
MITAAVHGGGIFCAKLLLYQNSNLSLCREEKIEIAMCVGVDERSRRRRVL